MDLSEFLQPDGSTLADPQAPPAAAPAPAQAVGPTAALLQALQASPQIQTQTAPAAAEQQMVANSQNQLQALYDQYKRQAYGMSPDQANPTTGQKIKRGAVEVLKAILQGNNYESLPDRIREKAQRDYVLENQRLQATAPYERLMEQLQLANNRLGYMYQALAEKSQNDQNRNVLGNRNADLRDFYNTGRIGAMNDRNSIGLFNAVNNAPVQAARANLFGTQNQNLLSRGGLTGAAGNAYNILQRGQPAQGGIMDVLQQMRDATKFPPQANSGSQQTFHFLQPEQTVSPDTGELTTQTPVVSVDKRTGAITRQVIPSDPAALTKQGAVKYEDFNDASSLAKDLSQLYASSITKGQAPNFMGLLQGNPYSQALRAKGLLGNGTSPEEALAKVFGATGLFQSVGSFAGRRMTNRELDYMKGVLGKLSDDPRSALAASLAAHYTMDAQRMKYGHLLPANTRVDDVIDAQINKYMNDVKNGKVNDIPSLQQLLIQNGRLKSNGQSGSNRLFNFREVPQ